MSENKQKEENQFQKISIKRESSKKNNAKLMFGKNLLIQLLKKKTLRKFLEKKIKSKNNIDNFNVKDKNSTDKAKKIYKSFQKIPEMKKFHNITAEKICDLIYQKNEITNSPIRKSHKFNKLQLNLKTEEYNSKPVHKTKKFVPNWKTNINTQYWPNNTKDKENNNYPRYKNNIKYINISDLNINKENKENILPYLSSRLNYHNKNNKKYNSLSKIRKNLIANSSPKDPKKLFNNKTVTNYATNKWLESIKSSIKRYDVLHRSSRIDRLIFLLENPDGCFEENLLEDRPGDRYILLKHQMTKYKNKFDNIIREIKLNQKKSEYLMKKYIFDLLSRKKDIN